MTPAVYKVVLRGRRDKTAPTITSSATASVAENVTLSHALTANETVTWSIVGGADQARFEISGSTLRWASNGTKDFESPDDANTDNDYIVTVRATDSAGNTTDQGITVTVTDTAASISFVGASTTPYATGTSQNQTIPTCNVGDMIIAFVMHRDTLTPQSGFNFVNSASATGSAISPLNQTLSVYSRVAQSGDSGGSTTWTQGTSQRMSVHIAVFRKTDGTPSVVDHDTTSTSNTSSGSNAVAVSTATANNQMGVIAGTSIVANNSPSTTNLVLNVTSSSQTTTNIAVDNRLCAGYIARNNTETTTGNVTTSAGVGAGAGGWAMVSLIIG